MTIGLILFAGVLTILMGRWMFGTWFNHVGLYGSIWSATLALFHVGLIHYYPLEAETWLVIIAGWLAFLLGSASMLAVHYALPEPASRGEFIQRPPSHHGLRGFAVVLWILNAVITAEAIHHLQVISNLIGGLANFNRVANVLYFLRVKQEIPGMIPYLGSAGFAACLLAGVYTSRKGRVQLVSLIPLVVTIVESVLNMSRGTMIIGGVLFACGYTLSKEKGTANVRHTRAHMMRRIITITLSLTLFVVGIEFVRSSRGINEHYNSEGTDLAKLRGGSFITPSVVFYASSSYGVLNQYLKRRDEDVVVGAYSLAPFWRLLAKFGFPTYVPQVQPFYLTPISANNGTYLRELDADFGTAGIVVGPYLMGFLASAFWVRSRRTQKLVDMMILGHIYVIVAMSLWLMATQWGYWLASLLFGLGLGYVIDHLRARKIHA